MKKIINDLEKIYFDLQNKCKLYDYNCRQCPHDNICEKVSNLILKIYEYEMENENYEK